MFVCRLGPTVFLLLLQPLFVMHFSPVRSACCTLWRVCCQTRCHGKRILSAYVMKTLAQTAQHRERMCSTMMMVTLLSVTVLSLSNSLSLCPSLSCNPTNVVTRPPTSRSVSGRRRLFEVSDTGQRCRREWTLCDDTPILPMPAKPIRNWTSPLPSCLHHPYA